MQRLVHTADHADILQDYDDCLVAAVENLLVGRGRFTELAALKGHIPAALGGLGVESVAARADACYYSSFTCAYFRLPDIDPEWHDGELYDSVAGGHHGRPRRGLRRCRPPLARHAWRRLCTASRATPLILASWSYIRQRARSQPPAAHHQSHAPTQYATPQRHCA